MKFPVKAVAAGILAGIAFFFVPFLFRFFLFALLIGFVIRLVGGGYRRGWGRRFYGRPGFSNRYNEDDENDIVPIDGTRYVSSINSRGPEHHFTIN